jgi:hypothetical protein
MKIDHDNVPTSAATVTPRTPIAVKKASATVRLWCGSGERAHRMINLLSSVKGRWEFWRADLQNAGTPQISSSASETGLSNIHERLHRRTKDQLFFVPVQKSDTEVLNMDSLVSQ